MTGRSVELERFVTQRKPDADTRSDRRAAADCHTSGVTAFSFSLYVTHHFHGESTLAPVMSAADASSLFNPPLPPARDPINNPLDPTLSSIRIFISLG